MSKVIGGRSGSTINNINKYQQNKGWCGMNKIISGRSVGVVARAAAVLAFGAMAAVSITGCMPPTVAGTEVLSSGKSIDIHPRVKATLTIVDLEVSPTRVSGAADRISYSTTVKTMEETAVANAINSKGANVLVGPMFNYKYNNTGSVMNVTVFGYPGYYKNFRTYDPKYDPEFTTIHAISDTDNIVPPNTSTVVAPVLTPNAAPVQTPPANAIGQ